MVHFVGQIKKEDNNVGDFCYAYQEYFQGEKKDAAHYFIVILNEDVFYHAILYPIVFFKNI